MCSIFGSQLPPPAVSISPSRRPGYGWGGEEETKWVEKQKEDVPVTAPSGQDEFGYLKYNDPIAAASRPRLASRGPHPKCTNQEPPD